MKKLLMITLLPVAALAAEDNVLRWTPPATYENGTPLPAFELKEYRVNVTVDGVQQAGLVAPGGTNSTFTHRVNSRGNWCYTLQTVSIDDQVSVPSNQACKRVTHGNPRPPTAVTAE